MILLVVAICISVPTAFGMEWLNIKRVSREREKEQKIRLTEHEPKAGISVAEPESVEP